MSSISNIGYVSRRKPISESGEFALPLATAQTLARHSMVELTANIYTHIDQQKQIDAINSLPGW